MRVMLVGEVASECRVSVSKIRRDLHESRNGRGNFPLPISPPGGKLRWLASDIEAYLASLSVAPPVNIRTPQEIRQDKKAFEERQRLADKALEKHRIPNRNERKTS